MINDAHYKIIVGLVGVSLVIGLSYAGLTTMRSVFSPS